MKVQQYKLIAEDDFVISEFSHTYLRLRYISFNVSESSD